MAKLSWSNPGSKVYESGIDRGVLYLKGFQGIPWIGLTAVNESPTGGDPLPYYLDGYKYINLASTEEYAASIQAYQAPVEFARCEGVAALSNGLFATQQRREQFSFSYRTLLGNEESVDYGYKIHLVYDALTTTSDRNNTTLNNSPSPMNLSWNITSKPNKIPGMRPTAHLIIDSTKTNQTKLAVVEGYLYGGDGIDPFMPTPQQLITLFGS